VTGEFIGGVYRDDADPNNFVESFVVESWTEYL